MTGAHLRVKRDGRWQNIEVEYLTNEERFDHFGDSTGEEVLNWLNLVCENLQAAEHHIKSMEYL